MKFLHELAESFYFRPFYSRLCFRGSGIGIRFILAITLCNLLFALQGILRDYPIIGSAFHEAQEKLESFPEMTVRDGKLSIDQPSPYVVPFGTHYVMFNINYRIGDVNALTQYMKNNSIVALLTADKKVLLNGQGKLEIDDWGSHPMTISHATWHTIAGAGLYWTLGFMIVFAYLYYFIVNLVYACIVAVAMVVVGLMMGAYFPGFAAAVRVAAAMRIPAKLINTEPYLLGLVPSWAPWGFITWVIWLGYFFFAVWGCRKAYEYAAD